MIVRSEHDLPTIRVGLGRSRRGAEVVFEVVRGRGIAQPVASCFVEELGLPPRVSGSSSVAESRFVLPDRVLQSLGPAIEAVGPSQAPDQAIWLELPSPRGYLALVPWELIFAPLHRPVLRLPYYTLRPRASDQTLEVAICASTPHGRTPFSAAAALDRAARAWLARAQHDVTVHLFADAASVDETSQRTRALGSHVVVHDIRTENPAQHAKESPRRSSDVRSLWLVWIRDALGGQALDGVHLIAHGFLSGDRGAVALASTPLHDPEAASRFVDVTELTAFLSQIGASSLVLSGPEGNYCPAGLRALGDAVALARPGVSVVHELGLDSDCAQLSDAIGMIFGGEKSADWHSLELPAITCWAHPQFLEFPDDDQSSPQMTVYGSSSLLGPTTIDVLDAAATPAWVAAGARSLENQQAQWMQSDPGARLDQEAVAALQSVSELLDKHVRDDLRPAAGESL